MTQDDLTTGYWDYPLTIKADAIPLGTEDADGFVKEAWDTDDYETVKTWVDYTPEQLEANAAAMQLDAWSRDGPDLLAAARDDVLLTQLAITDLYEAIGGL